jgi:hypothetical protein
MGKKSRLIKNFERLNNVKLDESLLYAHVDSAAPEPNRDQYQIGTETVGLNEDDPMANPTTNSSIKKEVRYLVKGDVIVPTNLKVLASPSAGFSTPKGKMEVYIEYPDGRKNLVLWGKYTELSVIPAPPQTENPV